MRIAFGLGLAMLSSAAFAQGGAPSFSRDVAPILKTRCATCHLTGKEAGNVQLIPATAYANLVGVRSTESPLMRVTPGNPDASYMIRKIEGTHIAAGGKGARMPFAAPPLPAEQIALIRTWVAQGAKRN